MQHVGSYLSVLHNILLSCNLIGRIEILILAPRFGLRPLLAGVSLGMRLILLGTYRALWAKCK